MGPNIFAYANVPTPPSYYDLSLMKNNFHIKNKSEGVFTRTPNPISTPTPAPIKKQITAPTPMPTPKTNLIFKGGEFNKDGTPISSYDLRVKTSKKSNLNSVLPSYYTIENTQAKISKLQDNQNSIQNPTQSNAQQSNDLISLNHQEPKAATKNDPTNISKIEADTYTVKEGDHLHDIVFRKYGFYSSEKIYGIAKHNNIKNVDLIYPDQVIDFSFEKGKTALANSKDLTKPADSKNAANAEEKSATEPTGLLGNVYEKELWEKELKQEPIYTSRIRELNSAALPENYENRTNKTHSNSLTQGQLELIKWSLENPQKVETSTSNSTDNLAAKTASAIDIPSAQDTQKIDKIPTAPLATTEPEVADSTANKANNGEEIDSAIPNPLQNQEVTLQDLINKHSNILPAISKVSGSTKEGKFTLEAKDGTVTTYNFDTNGSLTSINLTDKDGYVISTYKCKEPTKISHYISRNYDGYPLLVVTNSNGDKLIETQYEKEKLFNITEYNDGYWDKTIYYSYNADGILRSIEVGKKGESESIKSIGYFGESGEKRIIDIENPKIKIWDYYNPDGSRVRNELNRSTKLQKITYYDPEGNIIKTDTKYNKYSE